MTYKVSYSIRLDVLHALIEEKHLRLLTMIHAEEAKPVPDQAVIDALDEERFALPSLLEYPDADRIDAAIDEWKAIIDEQRRSKV